MVSIMDISKAKGSKLSQSGGEQDFISVSNAQSREDGLPRCLALTKGSDIRCSKAARDHSEYCTAHKRWTAMIL